MGRLQREKVMANLVLAEPRLQGSVEHETAALGDLADAVTTTANNYRLVDSSNIDQALQIERGLYES